MDDIYETSAMDYELSFDSGVGGEDSRRRTKPLEDRTWGAVVRLLMVVLRAAVMVAVLSLFFVFAGAVVLALLHLLFAVRALRGLHHRRCRRRPNGAGLSARALHGLPTFRYQQSMIPGAEEGKDGCCCPVCLEGLRSGQRCRKLPDCGHVFHCYCVDRWLARSPACPICRRQVITARRQSLWF